ncbi:GNAT family N-acetyltransferase [Bianquea renquensis]|uniref:GNAT family N-acetyltransferase n=1 Tax=Bianquea renquensis TaxID=2763661 RepID=A0A926I0T5_9FIRM|nr:GNAT family N-acetyltransferase [Bianquea renquensis]MBC8542256.1 GNAT family N-acetyltransferase [Bianquea renquensis]
MKNITTRQFSVLGDCGKIYQFMLDIYERDWRNGVAAPFFEYAFSSFYSWMDISCSYKDRIWEDNGEIVAFCFYENPVTDIYFSLKPGYEELAPEMITYADKHMPKKDGKNQLILFGEQTALINTAKELGYCQIYERTDMQFDFEDVLDYQLPEGFHFVKPEEYDMDKISKCCWKGFNHEETEGAWDHQHEQNNYQLQVAPHATMELGVIIADEQGEYACCAGMWWTPENKLAYLEPLCTIPEYRNRGLAAAALSEMYRKTKKLGATHMTGGDNEFYKKIGYKSAVKWTYWKKE